MATTKFDVKHIENPQFLKTLNKDELCSLASDIRQEIIEATAHYGGHLSSNLGVVELTIALHRAFDIQKDKILFDVGHQCYTHKILTGRALTNLREKNGLSGYQKRSESPYDNFEAGHSSTSLSTAQGMALARDLNGEQFDIVAVIGDASISSGMAFEALNNIGQANNKVIIVLNDNEMSIGQPVGGLSRFLKRIRFSPGYLKSKASYKRLMFKTKFGYHLFKISSKIKDKLFSHISPSNLFEQLGFGYIGPINGHNLKALNRAFAQAKRSGKSVIVHVKTIKGKGYTLAENDKTGYWHGVTPFDIKTGLPKGNHPNMISWSHLYSNFLIDAMELDPTTYLVTPATGKGSGLEAVFKAYPSRCHDVGIAEEHAVTMASGLALAGKKPIVSIYSTFLQRAFDQFSHDIARQNLDCTFLIDRAGLVGPDGETHQGIYDESFLISTPNVTLCMASRASEARTLLAESFKHHGPFAIRYPRDFLPIADSDCLIDLPYGRWKYERHEQDRKVALITLGPIVPKILTALQDETMPVTVVNALYQKPLDLKMLEELTAFETIIIHDAYATTFGFPNAVSAALNALNYHGHVVTMAIEDTFVKQATIQEQLDEMKVNVLDVIAKLKTFY